MTENTAVNSVRLVGTIGLTDKAHMAVQVLTKAVSKGTEYITSHAVIVAKIEEWMVEGQKVDCKGEFKQVQKRTMVSASEIEKAPKNAKFINFAKIQGNTVRAYEYFPPKPGKGGFGNLMVSLGDILVRAVVFNHKARTLNDNCVTGSLVETGGRINYRESKRPDSNGNQLITRFTEIIGESDRTNIIEVAVLDDPTSTDKGGAKPAGKTPAPDNIPF